ncbi:hypothetical protein NQ317_005854 [Molorchus minor]|uniref:Uncharacterized protein n=1 Tax=Molorchus minor TaxID=1323400 RepID=A0ABQ9IY09_9CUCU|nr:hypothetical protein NQ317_005854 [Molorchus minor]
MPSYLLKINHYLIGPNDAVAVRRCDQICLQIIACIQSVYIVDGSSALVKSTKKFMPQCSLSKCTMNNCESKEIVEAANIAISNLLPTKSRSLYDIAYNRFKKWCAEKNVQVYSENVLLAYFSENAKNYKSSTLWAQ